MSLYKIVDHRAPDFFPHNEEPHLVGTAFYVVAGMVGFVSAILTIGLIASGMLSFLLPLAILLTVAASVKYFRTWVYDIPSGPGYLTGYHINEHMIGMKRLYNSRRDLPELGDLLTSAYRYARAGDEEAVKQRWQLMNQYADENPRMELEHSDPELENFKINMEIRREMRKEGLL